MAGMFRLGSDDRDCLEKDPAKNRILERSNFRDSEFLEVNLVQRLNGILVSWWGHDANLPKLTIEIILKALESMFARPLCIVNEGGTGVAGTNARSVGHSNPSSSKQCEAIRIKYRSARLENCLVLTHTGKRFDRVHNLETADRHLRRRPTNRH
jgi:hypothetical protein